MRLLIPAMLFASFGLLSQGTAAKPFLSLPQQTSVSPQESFVTVPPGTKVILAVTSPVWSKSARPGDPIYGVTAFPVSIDNTMVIPPGTYVQGVIDSLTLPTRKLPRAEFQLHFTKIIFANGYTVPLSTNSEFNLDAGGARVAKIANQDLLPQEVPPPQGAMTATVHVEVSPASDILLDNGSQIETTLESQLTLNAQTVAAAVRQSTPPQLLWASATQCRPTPGTPGSPDTINPGTPGSPGTPDTVISQGPDLPPITIPGIPATPGTPATVTPGSPGTPGTFCPGPPAVISEAADIHEESFKISGPVRLAGRELKKGSYQVSWDGPGPDAQVRVMQKGKLLDTLRVRVATLETKSPQSRVDTASDGSRAVTAIEFKGKTYALAFAADSHSTPSPGSSPALAAKQ
jgi:hypothetical protein